MVNIPNKVVEEKLNDIATAYGAVTNAVSKDLASSLSLVNAYNKLGGTAFAGMSGNEWQLQNALLEQDTNRAKAEAEAALQGYWDAQAVYAQALGGTAEEVKMAKDALNEATNKMNEKVAEAAAAEVNNFQKAMSNIDNYYKARNTYIDSLIENVKTINSYIQETSGYLYGSSTILENYNSILGRTREQYAYLAQDVAEMEAKLAQGVANGTILKGDTLWLQLTTTIQNTRNQMEQLRVTQAQLYKEMLDVPTKKVGEQIDLITRLHRGLNAAMSNGIMDSASMRTMMNQMNNELRSAFGEIYGYGYTDDMRTFIHQNGVIKDNLAMEESILKAHREAMDYRKQLLDQMRNDPTADQMNVYLADIKFEEV